MLKFSEMWLIDKIKKLFNKGIFLPQDEKNNLISNAHLKNGMLKLGTNIKVDEGYKLAILRYNKLFDLLNSGNYKIDETTVPRLYVNYFRSVKGRGTFAPKSIFADLYFVNMGKMENLDFKTWDKIVAPADERKVKINLKGKFSFKINNFDMFMSYFAEEWAVIKNKKLIKEIIYLFEMTLSKLLNKKKFTFKEYSVNEQDIEKQVIDLMLDAMKKYGIEITDFNIEDVLVSKKDIDVKVITKSSNRNIEDDVIKQAEATINSNTKSNSEEYSFVATSVNESSLCEKTDNEKNDDIANINKLNDGLFESTGNETKSSSNNLDDFNLNINTEEKVLHEEQPTPKVFENTKDDNPGNIIFMPEHTDEKVNYLDNLTHKISDDINTNNNIQPIKEDLSLSQKEKEKTIEQGNDNLRKDDKSIKIKEESSKPLNKANLKNCPCCGAKNFVDADICCVCKSKLD